MAKFDDKIDLFDDRGNEIASNLLKPHLLVETNLES